MSPEDSRTFEQQLRESEERYRLTFEYAPIGIVIADPGRRLVRSNRRFCEIVGYSADEILRLTIPQLSHPDDIALMDHHLGRLERRESDLETYERRYVRRDGSVVLVEVTVSLVRDANGRPAYFVGAAMDITERKATAGQLALQARILDSVRQAVVVSDLDGRITFWSRFAEELYGWQADEVLGRNVLAVIPAPASVERASEAFSSLTAGRPWTGEFDVQDRSGREFTALVTESPLLGPSGELSGVIGVSQDVTELRSARLQEAALARIGSLAVASVSLDFLFSRSAEAMCELLGAACVHIHKERDGRLVVVGESGSADAQGELADFAEAALSGTQPVLVRRTDGTDAPAEPGVEQHDVTGVGVIIDSGQTKWGVVTVSASGPFTLRSADVDFLRTVVMLLGQAIERRRVEVELHIRAAQQSAIAELGRLTITTVDQSTLERACDLVMEALEVEHVALLEPSGDGSHLDVIAGDRSLGPQPLHESHAGMALASGETVILTAPGDGSAPPLPETARSGIATRLGSAGRRPGVLCAWTVVRRTFTTADVEFLESMALIIMEAQLREAARAELTESEHRYRSVVEGSSEIIFSVAPTGEVLSLNRAFEAVTGWKAEDWIGRPFIGLLTDDDRQAKMELFASIIREPRHIRLQASIRGAFGVVLFDVACSPRVVNGEVTEIYGFARDITEERRLGAMLEQANRLSSLGRLAATVAHEFNNVLMGILPFTEILRREAGTSDTTVAAVDQIARSVSRGKRITEDILRFAQPAEPMVVALDVAAWLETLAVEARSLVGPSYKVELDVERRDLFVSADQHQMHQAFVNLILNARDAMPSGGVIRLSVRREDSGARFSYGAVIGPERYAHLIVEDTGTGIGPEAIAHIFEPLFTTKKTGTGLGLPVTRQVVARHGGEIFVETEPGRGTRFHLFIPLAMDRPVRSVPDAVPARKHCSTILLVEDDPAVATGLSTLLELEGVAVTVVTTGAAVLPAIATARPDAVVLDIGLPDMDGTEVFRSVAEIYPDLPVVFSSGHGDATQLERFLATPHVAFLLKPYDIDVLLQALDRVVS